MLRPVSRALYRFTPVTSAGRDNITYAVEQSTVLEPIG
jgi:hypothetical protein